MAAGEPLPKKQSELTLTGHAIEARHLRGRSGSRFSALNRAIWIGWDCQRNPHRCGLIQGSNPGDTISPFYDPMIAKLIVHGDSRELALSRMVDALAQFRVLGVANNVPFLSRLVQCDSFVAPDLDTALIERESAALFVVADPIDDRVLCIAALHRLLDEREAGRQAGGTTPASGADAFSPWHLRNAWRLNLPARWRVSFDVDGELTNVSVQITPGGFEFRLREQVYRIAGQRVQGTELRIEIDGYPSQVSVVERAGIVYVFDGTKRFQVVRHDPVAGADNSDHGGAGLTAPMPGKIIAVKTQAGARVARGDALLIMEAMKMEHTIAAPADGVVATVHYGQGDQVEEGVELVTFETAKSAG